MSHPGWEGDSALRRRRPPTPGGWSARPPTSTWAAPRTTRPGAWSALPPTPIPRTHAFSHRPVPPSLRCARALPDADRPQIRHLRRDREHPRRGIGSRSPSDGRAPAPSLRALRRDAPRLPRGPRQPDARAVRGPPRPTPPRWGGGDGFLKDLAATAGLRPEDAPAIQHLVSLPLSEGEVTAEA